MGDPGKVVLLERVLKVIRQENLLSLVCETGKVLKEGLHGLEKDFPSLVNSVRGRGTFLSFNSCNTETRDKINTNLKKNGTLIAKQSHFFFQEINVDSILFSPLVCTHECDILTNII